MPYRFIEDVSISDAAFEAFGDTVEALFKAAAEATMNVMVEDLEKIENRERRRIEVEDDAYDMLLFQFLQELIFYKDSERLLLRVEEIEIERKNGNFRLSAEAFGEELDPERHELNVDVKAVTLYRLSVEETSHGWKAIVILDI